MWKVYDKTGTKVRCEVRKVQYSGTFMGECFVNTTLYSELPIDFEIGDYFIYRNELFTINYDPSVLKKAGKRKSGESYVYDGIKFNSYSDELTRCDFLDYVLADNSIHFSALPTFSFFASSIQDLADRIQANLDRVYTSEQKWNVEVHSEYVNAINVNIDVSKIKVWGALEFIKSKFKANFIIRGRKIIIGTAGVAIDNVFQYGKDNGLVEIQRVAESNQQIITRLRVYGSTRNLPVRYYNKLSNASLTNYLPNNMAVQNLMLPDFPRNTLDVYIDSPNISVLGVREDCVYFDGSDESLPEIYPSMEGMTVEQLIDAGISCNIDAGDNGNLDEIVSNATDKDGKPISDDGTWDELKENDNIPPFVLILKDIGFDLNDYLTGETATISLKDGMCGGREFEITKCDKQGNKYILTCNRVYDDGLKLYFPYKDYSIKAGDKFVLLNIGMPEVYISAAAQRLLKAGKEYLAKNDYVRYTYEVKIDDIYMARHPQLYSALKEGDLMLFTEPDFNIDGSIIIDSLRITEGEGLIPTYEVTLADEKGVGTLDKIQNIIDSISNGQGSGGYNAQQIDSLIRVYGRKYFLNKQNNDKAAGLITFLKGLISEDLIKALGGINTDNIQSQNFTSGMLGTGGCFKTDPITGKSYIEVDEAYIRLKAVFDSLEIRHSTHIGGQQILSPAGMTCLRVEEYPTFYRCFMKADDGSKAIQNLFTKDDQAQCRDINVKDGIYENVSNQYYWRLVINAGDDYIDLSKDDCDAGSLPPKNGDKICQLGNRSDRSRQNAIILSTVGLDAPSFKQYAGIDSYSLEGKEVSVTSPNGNRYVGDFILNTGVNVATQMKVLENLIKTEIQSIEHWINDEENYLNNASFSLNLEGWQRESDLEVMAAEEPLVVNGEYLADATKIAEVISRDNKYMLRLKNSYIKQLNSELDQPGSSGKFYLSFRYLCDTSGTLACGFEGQGLYKETTVATNRQTRIFEFSGNWDGSGDFLLRFTGDIYISLLTLTNRPLDDFKKEVSSKFEQTATNIQAAVKSINNIDKTIKESGWLTSSDSVKIWSALTFNDENKTPLSSLFEVRPEGIFLKSNVVEIDATLLAKIIFANGLYIKTDTEEPVDVFGLSFYKDDKGEYHPTLTLWGTENIKMGIRTRTRITDKSIIGYHYHRSPDREGLEENWEIDYRGIKFSKGGGYGFSITVDERRTDMDYSSYIPFLTRFKPGSLPDYDHANSGEVYIASDKTLKVR